MNHWKDFVIADRPYRVNLWIFRIICVLCLALVLLIFFQDNWSGEWHGYSYCPLNSSYNSVSLNNVGLRQGCVNVFYGSKQCLDGTLNRSSDLCTVKDMYPGQSLGTKPTWYQSNLLMIVLGLFIVGFIFNTLLFNLKFFSHIKPPIIDGGIGGTI